MEQKLHSICESFIQNRNIFKETFMWDSRLIYPICAMMYVEKDKLADKQKLLESKVVLKENTAGFSNFRSHIKLPVITTMALSNYPEERITKTIEIYAKLKKNFWATGYLALGAMIISDMTEDYEGVTNKAHRIYTAMKKLHPFLTSSEDVVYCLLLALSDKNEEEIINETEKCYDLLKSHFYSKNSVQALSLAVALLEGTSEEKCNNTLKLFNDLKVSGYNYGSNYELANLGLLANLGVENKVLIDKFSEVESFLKTQKGYGFFGLSQKMRYMHVSMILLKYFGKSDTNGTLNIVLSLVIAEQIALMAVVTASAAVSSSN